jgi:hypothetical protein
MSDSAGLHGVTFEVIVLTSFPFIWPKTKVYFVLIAWGGVRLSPLGTSATNWPIVPAPDDR